MAKQNTITCLGKTFANGDERREYFRNELRKKLPDLKKIEGFPIGEDEDIIALSDPPYFTMCPNPWTNDILDDWEREKLSIESRKEDFPVLVPYAEDVSEGKYDPIYLYHPYPTKVPHKAIMRYILHYTQPGDIIFDGFAGTGMTGVAAQVCANPDAESKYRIESDFQNSYGSQPIWGARKAICGDLSTLASFVSFNYNCPARGDDFAEVADGVVKDLTEECRWMYETLHSKGGKGIINYTIWSDVFICHTCNFELVFWDVAVDKKAGKVKEYFHCPKCKTRHSKNKLERATETIFDSTLNKATQQKKSVPVFVNYTFAGKRYEKVPDPADYDLVRRTIEMKIPDWHTHDRMPLGDEARRNDSIGITHVHQFYTARNLITLSALKRLCSESRLNILLTKVAFQTTKLYRLTYQSGVWGAGGGPLSGTLYVPSLVKELNVLKQVADALESRKRMWLPKVPSLTVVSTSSNVSLPNIRDNSIDYIFTDPPFGANLMYSELNFITESWLKVRTNAMSEAIQNKSQEKTLLVYQELMTKCFKENYRILKPGKWMTVEFSNTSAAVWNAIQTALQMAGFVLANVSALDKKKNTFKAVTTPTAVKQDLVITCYKPSEIFSLQFHMQLTEKGIWQFIEEHLRRLPIYVQREKQSATIIERTPRILFDRLITYYLMKGLSIPIDSVDFQAGLRQRFVERDGMHFLSDQALEYDKQTRKHGTTHQLSLFDAIYSESDAIEWLTERLKAKPQKSQDVNTEFRKANVATRKGEAQIELKTVLAENFIEVAGGKWRVPDLNEAKDREALRNKALLREFEGYITELNNGKSKKLKEVRVEALRVGFKARWEKKDFQNIVFVSERIPQNILLEDEQLLMYYDIAKDRV